MIAVVEVQAAGALSGVPARDPEDVAGPHHPADSLSPRRHAGPRRNDPAEPGAGAHAAGRQTRGFAAERDRLLGDPDGSAALVRMAHVAADVDRIDRRAPRGGRGAFQPVGPAGRFAELAGPVVRPRAAGGTDLAPAGRLRATWSPWPRRSASCPSSRRGSRPGSRSGSTSSRRPSSSARRSAPRSRPPCWDDPPLAVKEGGLIRDGYHPGLDELRASAKGGKSWIAKFQAEQVRRTGIHEPQGRIQQGFRLLHRDHACPGAGPRRQHSRGLHPQADGQERRALHHAGAEGARGKSAPAEDRACELEYELFTTLRDRVSAEAPRLIQAGAVLAQLDVLAVAGRAGRPARLLPPRDRRRAGLRGRSGPPSRARRDPRAAATSCPTTSSSATTTARSS